MAESKSVESQALKNLLAEAAVRETSAMSQDDKDRETDRALKKTYACWVLGLLIGQLLLMNVVLVLTGLKILTFDEWLIKLYLSGTLAEVFGIVIVITRHLFPRKK